MYRVLEKNVQHTQCDRLLISTQIIFMKSTKEIISILYSDYGFDPAGNSLHHISIQIIKYHPEKFEWMVSKLLRKSYLQ